jgi:hydrogenase maturation protein HypF
MSQHIGDLEHHAAASAFEETIADLLKMYDLRLENMLVAFDAHPQYRSTQYALALPASRHVAIQHHRAHVASVLAEKGEWDRPVLGVAFDGTGYGDDGAIWGGEIFAGSVLQGFRRIAHLRPAMLAGGDAAARHPLQAAAGFLAQLGPLPDLTAPPFEFSGRYAASARLLQSGTRTFRTTSVGRLFDTAAALVGFTRPVTFEGQASMWLESLARKSDTAHQYDVPLLGDQLDFRPLLSAVLEDRLLGCDPSAVARAFQRGLACGVARALLELCRTYHLDTVVLSGGVFQNQLLLEDLQDLLEAHLRVWTNHSVPPNDGGISLGQAALAAMSDRDA